MERGGGLTASLLGLGFDGVVLLHARDESITALGGLHVLGADVDLLGDDPATHELVHNNTDGTGGDVPHAASAAVVELVRHALVDGTVGENSDVVAKVEGGQVRRRSGETVSTEGARKL